MCVINVSSGGFCFEGLIFFFVGCLCFVWFEVDGCVFYIFGMVLWCKFIGMWKMNCFMICFVYFGGMEYDCGLCES